MVVGLAVGISLFSDCARPVLCWVLEGCRQSGVPTLTGLMGDQRTTPMPLLQNSVELELLTDQGGRKSVQRAGPGGELRGTDGV